MLYISLEGICEKEEIQQAAASLRQNLEKIKVASILADTSHLGMMKDETLNLVIREVFPLFRELGIKKAAVIRSLNSYGQLSLMQMLSHVQLAEIEEFGDIESAHTWLLSN